jgi:hypothetical protein
MIKQLNTDYAVDKDAPEGVTLIYSPIYEPIDGRSNFIGKYLYSRTVKVNGTSTTLKFYTRFKYHGEGENPNKFLDEPLLDKTIYSLLFPGDAMANKTVNKEVTFAESVRVSLSAGKSRVYTNYKKGTYINKKFGTISCDSSFFVEGEKE